MEDTATINSKCFRSCNYPRKILRKRMWSFLSLSSLNTITPFVLQLKLLFKKSCHPVFCSLGLLSWIKFLDWVKPWVCSLRPVWPVIIVTFKQLCLWWTRCGLITLLQSTCCSCHSSIPRIPWLIRWLPVHGSQASGPKKLICIHHS